MARLERDFQPKVKQEIKRRLPDSVTIKMDAGQLQGVPDLLVLDGPNWALLETKRGAKAAKQPNQDYYVEKFGEMSFSAFITPENMDEVLDDLQQAFRGGR